MTTLHKAATAFLAALKADRHDTEDWPGDSRKTLEALRAALAQEPAQQDQNTRIVKVTSQGVSFGDAWFSHERITGKSAACLNEGGSGVAARQYMKWLSTAQEPAQPAASVAGVIIGSPLPDVCQVNTPDTDRAKALLKIFSNGPDVSVQGCLGDKEAPTVEESFTPFDDPRVQVVYDVLCDTDDRPPKGSELHWEGWVAQRVVDRLFAKRLTNEQMAALLPVIHMKGEAPKRAVWLTRDDALRFGRQVEAVVLGEKP